MKITVTQTVPGAPDGVHTQLFKRGEIYDMPDDLGAVFVREGWGHVDEPIKPSKSSEPTKSKKAKGPTENK